MSLMGYYIHLAIGLLLDLWSLIICLFTGVPAMERNNGSNDVCILIPGVFGNAVCFNYLSMEIEDPVDIFVYKYSAFSPMETIVTGLKEKCEGYFKNKNIFLVGHSYGGLVSCYFYQNCSEDFNIKQVYAIAAPLKGAKVKDLYTYIMQLIQRFEPLDSIHKAIKSYEKESGFSNIIAAINKSPIDEILSNIKCVEATKDHIVGPYASPNKDITKTYSSAHQDILKNQDMLGNINVDIQTIINNPRL